MTFKNKHSGVFSGNPRHRCPDEIDNDFYVKMPPERSYGMIWGNVRIVTCTLGYSDKTRDCNACGYYDHCDAPERVIIEGKEWTPPMRSRSEIKVKIEELGAMNRYCNDCMITALEWMLGIIKDLK